MESDWRIGVENHRFSSVIESPARVFQISSPSNSSASVSPANSSASFSSACSPFNGNGSVAVGVGVGGSNYIEHRVSKFDTLAGVAIKYGVEVIVVDLVILVLKCGSFVWLNFLVDEMFDFRVL